MRFIQTWIMKFAVAFRGLGISLRDQSSLQLHVFAAVSVLSIAAYMKLELWRWAVLVLAITVVIAAELMNTAIERPATPPFRKSAKTRCLVHYPSIDQRRNAGSLCYVRLFGRRPRLGSLHLHRRLVA